MVLSKKQESALVGMILGDGFLQKTGENNARLRLEHSSRQKEYLKWKMELFPQFFQSNVKELSRVHPKTKKIYHYTRGQSTASPILGKLRRIFYPGGRKRIPENLSRYLRHPLGLAIWYLDDGYYYARDKVIYLYLGRIALNDAKVAQRSIEERFELKSILKDKKDKGYVLYFSPSETQKFNVLINEFVITQMRHKLPSLTP